METFERMTERPRRTIRWKEFLAKARAEGATKEQARKAWHADDAGEHWRNDLYHVLVLKNEPHGFGEEAIVWWLSIKRHDREPVCDWRHLQQIKNEICGTETEGVMLYPAESRCVDTANQYHLFVVMNPGFRFPFGFTRGMKSETTMGASKQRAFGSES